MQAEDDQARAGRHWPPWVGYLPILLLLFVAANQMRIARSTAMTAWKGGGFGMFSTLDRPSARQVRVHLVGGGRDLPFAIPADLNHLEESAKSRPTEKKLIRLGREIAYTLEERLPGLESIRVEVWRRTLDLDSGTLQTVKWREAAYEIGARDD